MSTAPQRFPLDWPTGEPRTPIVKRERGRFGVSRAKALQHVRDELYRLGVRSGDVVISTNVRVRLDGLPYADDRPVDGDPGVAVYWTLLKADPRSRDSIATQYVMACDRFRTIEANLRAIGLTIEALRAIERHGTRQLRDRAFSGFASLPARAGASSWRRTLGLGDGPVTTDEIESAYRRAALHAHPDRGGTTEAMSEVTNARADALRELNGAANA